jgi:uncharacterized protein YjiS (DUF1127 family)
MSTLLKNMVKGYERYLTHRGRRKALEILLRADDRMLADNGFSRDLLELGLKGWPWRTTEEQAFPVRTDSLPAVAQKAVTELQSFSDAELHDLGITRGTIHDAVANGRSGVEIDQQRKVA